MSEYTTLKQIEKACRDVDSCASGSDGFMYKCFPYMMEQLTEIKDQLIQLNQVLSKKKREPSEWSMFLGKYLKEGKTIQEASEDWKKKKA